MTQRVKQIRIGGSFKAGGVFGFDWFVSNQLGKDFSNLPDYLPKTALSRFG
jgi:hypothetical protein